jgi:hypothetical protein
MCGFQLRYDLYHDIYLSSPHKLVRLSCFLPGTLALGLLPESINGYIVFLAKERWE